MKNKIRYSLLLSICIIALGSGIVTLLPTEIAPWHGKYTDKISFLGYYAHCSWTPISSILCFAASFYLFRSSRELLSDTKGNMNFILAGVIIGIIGFYFGIMRGLF